MVVVPRRRPRAIKTPTILFMLASFEEGDRRMYCTPLQHGAIPPVSGDRRLKTLSGKLIL
jgi:hypothetical protein